MDSTVLRARELLVIIRGRYPNRPQLTFASADLNGGGNLRAGINNYAPSTLAIAFLQTL